MKPRVFPHVGHTPFLGPKPDQARGPPTRFFQIFSALVKFFISAPKISWPTWRATRKSKKTCKMIQTKTGSSRQNLQVPYRELDKRPTFGTGNSTSHFGPILAKSMQNDNKYYRLKRLDKICMRATGNSTKSASPLQ